jgi:hypothetical protein
MFGSDHPIKFRIYKSSPVFRNRIHRIRIWIQHFRLNTDPDPDLIRIQGFDDQKMEKKFDIFLIKNCTSKKDVQATGEAFRPLKRTSST